MELHRHGIPRLQSRRPNWKTSMADATARSSCATHKVLPSRFSGCACQFPGGVPAIRSRRQLHERSRPAGMIISRRGLNAIEGLLFGFVTWKLLQLVRVSRHLSSSCASRLYQ